MTAAPFNKNPRAKHITNDGNAIRAAGNVLSVLMVKTHFGTGAIYKPSHSFFENIIGHMKNTSLWINSGYPQTVAEKPPFRRHYGSSVRLRV